jgi:hypothetical protein
MTPTQQAIAWALSRYNDDPSFRQTQAEIGVVLSADRATGELRAGGDIIGPDEGQVRPYLNGGLERVLEHRAGLGDAFLGDYHCHVGSGLFWTDHVPSPADLVVQSCLCDLWETPGLVLDGIEIDCFAASSQFQIMQANLFGDLFLILPEASRTRFQTLAKQQRAMALIRQAYGYWHLGARGRRDELVFPLRHSDFEATVRAELRDMNGALGGRGRIEFIENRGYKSDDDDFLE